MAKFLLIYPDEESFYICESRDDLQSMLIEISPDALEMARVFELGVEFTPTTQVIIEPHNMEDPYG